MYSESSWRYGAFWWKMAREPHATAGSTGGGGAQAGAGRHRQAGVLPLGSARAAGRFCGGRLVARGTRTSRERRPLTPEEFRRHGHRAIDWIAEFLEHVERYPVLPPVKPGELTDALPRYGPERGEPMEAIVADFEIGRASCRERV